MNDKENLYVHMAVLVISAFIIVGCSEKSSSASTDGNDVVYTYVRPIEYSNILNAIYNKGFQMDTVFLSSKYLKCNIRPDTFDCIRYFYCDVDEPQDDLIDRDTVYLNYGESKLFDYSFEVDVPKIDSIKLRKVFSNLRSSACAVLTDSLSVNYWLDAKGLPGGIWLSQSAKIEGFDWAPLDSSIYGDKPVLDETSVFSGNERCEDLSFPPDSLTSFAYCRAVGFCSPAKGNDVAPLNPWCVPGEKLSEKSLKQDTLMFRKYILVSTRTTPLSPDTVVNWKLIYIDQYGRSDSLAVTTRFK